MKFREKYYHGWGLFLFSFCFLIMPIYPLGAQEIAVKIDSFQEDKIFEARVKEVMQEREFIRENGTKTVQQNVRIIGLKEEWKDKEFIVVGISDIEVVESVVVKKGEHVLAMYSRNNDGQEQVVITDHIRRKNLFWLALVFSILMIGIGKWKGFASLFSLFLSFMVIMKIMVPALLRGYSPLLVSIIGSVIILAIIIYFTWGFQKKAHLAMISIIIGLIITGLLSVIFTKWVHLSGMSSEEVMFLVGIKGVMINFQGLLLAGIIIGALGVLDDVVISQISTIEQLKKANEKLDNFSLFRLGLAVGVDHLSSMSNTLFLAYAGASLPLLLLFAVHQEPSMSFSQVINNELIAIEVVRTLVGSIGIILTVPLSTAIAVLYYNKN